MREERKYRGELCLPGGKVDEGETLAQAAFRETLEKTCVELQQPEFLFYQESLPSEDYSIHCINFYFEADYHGKPRPIGSKDLYRASPPKYGVLQSRFRPR